MPDIEVIAEQWTTEVIDGGNVTIINSGAGLLPTVRAFEIPQTPWIVDHNLGYRPTIFVTDLLNNEIVVETAVTSDRITITPAAPMTGYLYYK